MNLRLLFTCLALLSTVSTAQTAPVSTPVVLVASGGGVDSYGETVVLALPLEGGHVGFILNMPTTATVADLFPGEANSDKVTARVDYGGPLLTTALFALVMVDEGLDIEGLHHVTQRFAVALDTEGVDRVIAAHPDNTRYFVGLLRWPPGSLEEQVDSGAWSVLEPDDRIVLSARPATLWPRLSRGAFRLVRHQP